MKNVLRIIISDLKRLSVNVVAMVVIIGLTVIPCLYAWFNILSNWDPYGEASTSNLQVAVASSDQGIVIGNIELNVGDIIMTNLKENNNVPLDFEVMLLIFVHSWAGIFFFQELPSN